MPQSKSQTELKKNQSMWLKIREDENIQISVKYCFQATWHFKDKCKEWLMGFKSDWHPNEPCSFFRLDP